MLRIRLFGSLELVGPDGARPPLPTRSSRHLLAYLALHAGRVLHRDVLAGVLWGDRPDRAARKVLRNSLWRLRSALEEAGGGAAISVESQEMGLLGDVWVDTAEFEALTGSSATAVGDEFGPEGTRALERAVALYRADLLDGVYDPWTVAPREGLRLVFLTALERLFAHHRASGDLHAAIVRGRTLVRHDPYRERVHRELMLCHWAMGDRPLAVRQYRACEKLLREELDMEPMDETRDLHDRIRSGDHPSGVRPSPPADPSLAGAVNDLYTVAARLARIRT